MLARRRAPHLTGPRTIVTIIGLGLLAACGDKSNFVTPIPVGAVTTFRDSAFNFSSLNTFSMPDSVVHFAPLAGTPLPVTREFDQAALEQVRQNFLARGFVEDTNPANSRPSFVVLVGATATTNYNAFIGYPWFTVWGFYPGWGFFTPGFTNTWTIVYPWFPVVGATSYDRGTIIVDLIPTASIDTVNQSVRSAWAGVATGALTTATTASTVTGAIDQMFVLSPYLVPGPIPTPLQRAPRPTP